MLAASTAAPIHSDAILTRGSSGLDAALAAKKNGETTKRLSQSADIHPALALC
jgi:hypothetical protein